ncbi:MAG: hypothetical protein ABI468_01080 [Candidatus Nanopelagicales bacterium]
MSDPTYLWLEPGRPDIDEGLRARVGDPVWFLARQWQLGEHRGEDASSPVAVDVTVTHAPITYDRRRPDLDPTVVPAEALLEAEPGDWWTVGRRVRLGRAAAALLDPTVHATYAFGTLPSPYEPLADHVDGRAVFVAGVLAGHAIWTEVPAPLPDRWSTTELEYSARFEAEGTALLAPEHDGGDVDWFTVDGAAEHRTLLQPATEPVRRLVVPSRLDYPGAPNPRWWELEDRAADIGGFSPDRSHLATMLLVDVAVAHSDDWFSFHVPPPADGPSSGVLVTLPAVTVTDSFDQVWPLAPPPVIGPGAWSLFHTAGLEAAQLLIWPVAVAPSGGPLLDDVLIGVDEDANLAWAVELRADGRQLLADAATDAAIIETTRSGTRNFRYLPSTTLPDRWHPYQRVRAGDPAYDDAATAGAGDGRSGYWRQAVLTDLNGPLPVPRPGPVSRLIGGPSGAGLGRGHELAPDAIPSTGARLQRRAMLARDTDGRPVLWVERSTRPVSGPPTSHLRFDVLAEDA